MTFMSFWEQNKAFLVMVIITILLVTGGIYIFSRPPKESTPTVISSEILAPSTAQKTASGSAEITLVEFGDFQCPACGTYHTLVKRLLEENPEKVNFVFRNFPLTQHQNAPLASYAAESAGLQNKYWEMHNLLYENQNQWSNSGDPTEIFIEYAKKLSLNVDTFKKDLISNEIKEKIEKDKVDGNLAKITATPTFFVNGKKVEILGTYEEFKKAVLASP